MRNERSGKELVEGAEKLTNELVSRCSRVLSPRVTRQGDLGRAHKSSNVANALTKATMPCQLEHDCSCRRPRDQVETMHRRTPAHLRASCLACAASPAR